MAQTSGTVHPGNTNTGCTNRKRARTFMITIYDDPIIHFEKAIYECWCDDTCKDGKHHMHQLVYFKNPIEWNTVKKQYPTSHIEIAKNVYDCIKYIKNPDSRKYNVQELGTEPRDTRYKTVGELKNVKNPDELDWRQYHTWEKINRQQKMIDRMLKLREQILTNTLEEVHCTYVVGDPGNGKTHAAYYLASTEHEITEEYPVPFGTIIFSNDFVDCQIPFAKCQVIEEFRSSDIKCSTLLQLIDKYSRLVNCKGGSVVVESNWFYFASYKYPHELYHSDENYKQFLRRFERIMHVDKNHKLTDITEEYRKNPFMFTSREF